MLDDLSVAFTARGYHVRSATYFADEGPLVSTPPVNATVGLKTGETVTTAVRLASVHVYRDADGWVLRLTPHGGPHWGRPVRESDIEAFVCARLE